MRYTDNEMQYYKFTPIGSRSIVSIATGKFYLPTLRQMNDPFEDRFANAAENTRLLVKNTGVFCVSAEWEGPTSILSNPLMWAHYGDNHSGVAIGLTISSNKRPFSEVRYRDESELQAEFQRLSDEYQNRTDRSAQPIIDMLFGFKQKFWHYENECRRVIFGANRYFDPGATINEVVFGFRTRPEDELAIWCARRNDIKYRKVKNADGNLTIEDYSPPIRIDVGDSDTMFLPHERPADIDAIENTSSPLVPTVTFSHNNDA